MNTLEFSKKEMEMIYKLSPHWYNLINNNQLDNSISAIRLLETIGYECFVNNKTGPAVDSLRKCLNACSKFYPYRMTDEYDKLIEL